MFVYRRESTITNLGAAETKLLYTLHWIVLDAAEECADADHEKGMGKEAHFPYHFSIPTIQVCLSVCLCLFSEGEAN